MRVKCKPFGMSCKSVSCRILVLKDCHTPCETRREGWNNVKVRLDRAIADDRWRDIVTNAQVHLVSPCSDHCPILLNFHVKDDSRTRKKCLHYEIIWEREAEFTEVVGDAWASAGDKGDLGEVNLTLTKVNVCPAFLE